MKRMKNIFLTLLVTLLFLPFMSCSDDDNPAGLVEETSTFAKGADVSWLTQMEASGKTFYNAAGAPMDCLKLLQSLGMNSIRLRVWVNPADGWCNKEDVLAKAWRVSKLGMRVMIDFHYSDTWTDPSKQAKPATWENLSLSGLENAVSAHTVDVLTALKDEGVTPEWVQVGNETGNGMLWDEGKASVNMANYAALSNAGYDAVKSVFPDTKVIVHLQNGNDNALFRWLFDGLKSNGAKWDVIGMSLYPSADNWQTMNDDCVANMNDMITRYGKEVMLCEVGMAWDAPEVAEAFLTDLITKSKAIEGDKCLGVFYWEPEAYGGWNNYALGAFDDSGKPTVALNAFK